jgi:hypothetical protein
MQWSASVRKMLKRRVFKLSRFHHACLVRRKRALRWYDCGSSLASAPTTAVPTPALASNAEATTDPGSRPPERGRGRRARGRGSRLSLPYRRFPGHSLYHARDAGEHEHALGVDLVIAIDLEPDALPGGEQVAGGLFNAAHARQLPERPSTHSYSISRSAHAVDLKSPRSQAARIERTRSRFADMAYLARPRFSWRSR